MTTLREIWRAQWLRCLNELTSLELQKVTWADPANTNPYWSFVECICRYFDDSGIDDNYGNALSKGWITPEEFNIIESWHNALASYTAPQDEDYNHQAILGDPRWLELVQKGRIRISILAETLDQRERAILTTEIRP